MKNFKELDEQISPEDIDLKSFKPRDIMNPKIWDPEGKLRKEVRDRLLMIADEFYESLELPWVDIEDIVLTGSLANFNWSKFSDVDLHVMVELTAVDSNADLAKEYVNAKKELWNENHDITIYGFDVELYVQDVNEKHVSSGVYSVMQDKWLIKPTKENMVLDTVKIREKAVAIMDQIDAIGETYENGDYNMTIKKITTLKDKIKKMRQAGLDREGEFSYENIAFKVLRRNGSLDRLHDLQIHAVDKSLSL